jgi:hypothetical protein
MRRLSLAIAALSIIAAGPAIAETRTYQSEYTVSAFGFPVGKSSMKLAVSSESYALSGTLSSAGIVRLLASLKGSMGATGKFSGKSVRADSFALDYRYGKKTQKIAVGYSGGAITDFVNTPEPRKTPDWVDVTPYQLAGALDPLSSSLVAAQSPGEVCGRTVRFFDGELLGEIRMRYLRTVPFYTKGYSGTAVTCRARFVPIAGYRKNKKEIQWLRDKGHIDIGFAPIAGTGFYAPVQAQVKTQIGMVRIRATRFETVAR